MLRKKDEMKDWQYEALSAEEKADLEPKLEHKTPARKPPVVSAPVVEEKKEEVVAEKVVEKPKKEVALKKETSAKKPAPKKKPATKKSLEKMKVE